MLINKIPILFELLLLVTINTSSLEILYIFDKNIFEINIFFFKLELSLNYLSPFNYICNIYKIFGVYSVLL